MHVDLTNINLGTITQTPPETGPNFVGLLDDYNQAVAAIANLNKNLEKLEKNPTGPGAKKESAAIEQDLETIMSLCNPKNLSGFYGYAGNDSSVKSAINGLVLTTSETLLVIKKDLASGDFNGIVQQVDKIENDLAILRQSILG